MFSGRVSLCTFIGAAGGLVEVDARRRQLADDVRSIISSGVVQ